MKDTWYLFICMLWVWVNILFCVLRVILVQNFNKVESSFCCSPHSALFLLYAVLCLARYRGEQYFLPVALVNYISVSRNKFLLETVEPARNPTVQCGYSAWAGWLYCLRVPCLSWCDRHPGDTQYNWVQQGLQLYCRETRWRLILSGKKNSSWRRNWGPAESTSCPGWVFRVK